MKPSLHLGNSFQVVLQLFNPGGMTSPPPVSSLLLDACVRVHDEMQSAAKLNALSEKQGELLEAMTSFVRASPTIEVLMEIAMAILYDIGIAQGRSGIVSDIAAARGVSRQHAYRQIGHGRVLLVFHRAGKTQLLPSGRKVEMIDDLPEEHWVPCWQFVVLHAEKKGRVSDRDAEVWVGIYKYGHQQFPKTPELRLPEIHENQAVDNEVATETVEEEAKRKNFLADIPPELADRLFSTLSKRARSSLVSATRRGDPAKVAVGVLVRSTGKKPSAKGVKVGTLFESLREQSPEWAQLLETKAQELLIEEFSAMIEQYALQLQKAAERHRRKKNGPEI